MSFFPKVERWCLPASVLERSIADMAVDGREGNEGTCFWLGNRDGGEAEVSHLVGLRGRGVRKSAFNVHVSAELMREVHERGDALGLILVGQIHSHSSECGVDMSPSDHAYGISVPYFLSIIVPHYAQDSGTTILDCGVHVCRPRRGYVRLSRRQIRQKIEVIPGLGVGMSIVGENL